KRTVEIVEIQRLDGILASEGRVCELAADARAQQAGRGDKAANGAPQERRNSAISRGSALVKQIPAVAFIPAEQFIAACPGEHYFHFLGSAARHAIERNAGGPGDRLVFVPDQARQRLEKVGAAEHDGTMLGADPAGDALGVSEFAETALAVTDRE